MKYNCNTKLAELEYKNIIFIIGRDHDDNYYFVIPEFSITEFSVASFANAKKAAMGLINENERKEK